MNNQTKTIFILRVILLICLIVFFVMFISTDKTNCEDCSFDIDGELVSAVNFFNVYSSKCLTTQTISPFNFSDQLKLNETGG